MKKTDVKIAFFNGYDEIGEVVENQFEEIYQTGKECCGELCDQEVSRYYWKNLQKTKIWTCKELQMMPTGCVFFHPRLGVGKIYLENGNKTMIFNDKKVIEFNYDGKPWDEPMNLIFISNEG